MTLNAKWKTYVDPIFPSANQSLIGRKGGTILDAGYVYSPYIPLYGSGIDSFDFELAPCPEPSIVDRIGALDSPDGELSKRIAAYDNWSARRVAAYREHLKASGIDPDAPPPSGPPMIDPADFALRRGLARRLRPLVMKPGFYSKVKLEDLK